MGAEGDARERSLKTLPQVNAEHCTPRTQHEAKHSQGTGEYHSHYNRPNCCYVTAVCVWLLCYLPWWKVCIGQCVLLTVVECPYYLMCTSDCDLLRCCSTHSQTIHQYPHNIGRPYVAQFASVKVTGTVDRPTVCYGFPKTCTDV